MPPDTTSPTQLLINIDVEDLTTAVRFYTEAFGFRVGRHLGPAAIELLGGQLADLSSGQDQGKPGDAGFNPGS
jgi:catechol 2,3-dioxygenase-like lactoylglutathione lyase family enzyme